MKNPIAAIAASFLTLTAASASAADFPKSGSEKGVIYFTAAVADELDGWETPFQPGIYVMTGVVRTDPAGSAFDKSYVRCVGERALLSGKFATVGACTQTDTEGDKAFVTFETGKYAYVGGTGKYKGLTGGGPVTSERIYQGKNDWAVIMAFEKQWEIK
jgi:hypothetical protein